MLVELLLVVLKGEEADAMTTQPYVGIGVRLQWPAREVGNAVTQDPGLLDALFGKFVT